jgi:transcriptional regulator with XRE-family HTH domain
MLRLACGPASLRTMPPSDAADEATVRKRFGAKASDASRRAGYDIDSPRGGGKARLARDTGMPESSVGRMLSGKSLPDPKFYEPLAAAWDVRVTEILEWAGIMTARSRGSVPDPHTSQVRSQPITPVQAAEELGIFDPVGQEMFVAMVERLRRKEQNPVEDGQDHAGGEAAQI